MAKAFDHEMEEYIGARRRASFNVKGFIQEILKKIEKKRPKFELHEEVEVYEEDNKAEKPQKEGILQKIFKKEEPAGEELIRTKMQLEDTITDIKEISKIALSAVKQLPDEQLRTFKQSPEFERLKVVLKKHELIK
ncbi:hypothetical protein KY309_02675 [Candidatus Woesearchaeota archaeon]|nr:hypothetical protein [Candidatus Woesearchaeota archaeon]MBW3016489.1 hypothetical protein [Candidatus Woesearchaeota archaeon]